jgi:hypothetical protein
VRWLAYAFVIAACDQGEPPPLPTYARDSFIEVSEVTASGWSDPPDRRRLRILGDGSLEDTRDLQPTLRRQIPPARFAELVHELKRAGALRLEDCGFAGKHGRFMTLTLQVPEGRNEVDNPRGCEAMRAPLQRVLDLAER